MPTASSPQPLASSTQTTSVRTLYQNNPLEVTLEDVAIAQAFRVLPSESATSDGVATAAEHLLRTTANIPSDSIDRNLTREGIDFIVPERSLGSEDVAALLASHNAEAPLNRAQLATAVNNLLAPSIPYTGDDVFALPIPVETPLSPLPPELVPLYGDRPLLLGRATVEMRILTASTGPISVQLQIDGNAAPLTAGNFIDLVERGFYAGLPFHRILGSPTPDLLQAGDPNGDGTGGFVDPITRQERRIPLEIQADGEALPRYNTIFPIENVTRPPSLRHLPGAVAMARANDPTSASSQFYIVLTERPDLDGIYAVFGQVISGLDSLRSVQLDDVIQSAQTTSGLENLTYPESQ